MSCQIDPQTINATIAFHGHSCPGLAIGMRAAEIALQEMAGAGPADLVCVSETDMCGVDAIQFLTGCTFGKGLMERTQYGKWALTLVDRATGKAVRVSVRPEVMQASFASPFVQQRKQGTAPSAIPVEVSRPLVEKQLARPNEDLFVISPVFDYPLPAKGKASFNLVLCSVCSEAVAENKARVRDGEAVCIPCSGYGG